MRYQILNRGRKWKHQNQHHSNWCMRKKTERTSNPCPQQYWRLASNSRKCFIWLKWNGSVAFTLTCEAHYHITTTTYYWPLAKIFWDSKCVGISTNTTSGGPPKSRGESKCMQSTRCVKLISIVVLWRFFLFFFFLM